ncbi:MAG: FAD-binding oxidoreductase [Planctomycetota bacterium]
MDRALLRQLRRLVPAERVLTDVGERSLYDSDGLGLHRAQPDGVVIAVTAREVQQVVALLHRAGRPFVPRGAGTGLSGGAVPLHGAWVIDVNRMRSIVRIEPRDRYAVVEPGVVNLDLDRAAARHGLRFAPDPSSQKACTLGGNIAENSGGPHCFLHGMTTRHVLGLTVVLPNGEWLRVGGPPGTAIDDDWRGLFVGSEGTFGITVEAVVALIPRPEEVRTCLAAFTSLRAACDAVARVIRAGLRPAALEILDQLTIRAVEASVYRAGYPQEAEAVLLIDQEGIDAEVTEEAAIIEQTCRDLGALSYEVAASEAERARLWMGRKGAFGAMGRIDRDLYVLDGVVPRRHLAEVVERVQEIGARHRVTLSNVFHAGDGNLHPNISFDARNPEVTARVLAAGREILELCVAVGGTLSGEHGIGLEKREFMPLVFSDDDLGTQVAIRDAVDPGRLANPGKIFPSGRGCVEAGHRTRDHEAQARRVLDP